MSTLDGLLLAWDRQQAMILDLLDVVADDHMALRALWERWRGPEEWE